MKKKNGWLRTTALAASPRRLSWVCVCLPFTIFLFYFSLPRVGLSFRYCLLFPRVIDGERTFFLISRAFFSRIVPSLVCEWGFLYGHNYLPLQRWLSSSSWSWPTELFSSSFVRDRFSSGFENIVFWSITIRSNDRAFVVWRADWCFAWWFVKWF